MNLLRLMALWLALAWCGATLAQATDAPGTDDEAALRPGKMGMTVQTFTPEQAAQAGDATVQGVRISEVMAGSAAAKLGLRVGDIIVQANGRPISRHTEIAALMRNRLVGAATHLLVRRGATPALFEIVVPAAAQPMLRLDAGMHNALIRRMAVDSAGRWLVTASEDKTAKVWELATGRLLRTLRPPVGDDNEGKLAAVALSPDGTQVALAGWTGMWDKSASVYIFDRSSARVLRQLAGLPGKISALAWSADAQFLAVGLAGAGALQVYRTRDWSVVGDDAHYAGQVDALDFDRRGRLVSASHDGYVRRYDVSAGALSLQAKRLAPAGHQPESVRFSPDGALLAVGYADATQVSVLAASSLELAYAPNTASVKNGDLRSVAWSADGRTLWAGGRYVVGSQHVIRSWSDAGRGQPTDAGVASNTLFDLQGLASGGVAYATAEPAWGVLARAGAARLGAVSPLADWRGAGEQLQLARDGQRVAFAWQRNTPVAAVFDLGQGLVHIAGAQVAGEVWPARTEFPGLVVSQWKNSAAPLLNGQPLRLRAGETARSLAIAPDGLSLVLGSDSGWSSFDRTGKLLGRTLTPGAVWAVNFSLDARYLVAALADGTLRWYSARTGQEKLALFVHSDQVRWVAWTPSGYYTASAGGEELIGWHINNGPDQAGDFYPAARFRTRFYRPDVLAKVLDTASEIEALRLANQEAGRVSPYVEVAQALPPVIDALSPTQVPITDSHVTLRFKLRHVDDAPLLSLRVRVNGQYLSDARNLEVAPSVAGEERSLSLQLPEQDSLVELFAQNRHGVSSPASFQFSWQGALRQKGALPTLHVLAIGVSDYQDPAIRLGFPAKDAQDFVAALKRQKGKLYGDVQVVLLTNEQASRQAVLEQLAQMKVRVKENDVGVLFIAGHGVNAKDGTYYYVPFDFDRKKFDTPQMDSTGVTYTAIRSALAEIPGRAMLFIDTCHSGNVLGKNDLTGAINDLTARENSVVVFASSTHKESSQEAVAWNNGAFTKALVAGLEGGGDLEHDGKVMYTGLQYYLSRTVSQLTRNAQHPVVLPGGIEDFVVSIP